MGLLDSITGALSSGQAGAAGTDITALIGSLLNAPQLGGLQGLVQSFSQNGLGEIVQSWVGTGANLPVSAQQIMSALGGHVQSLSASTGQSSEQLAGLLSEHLPGLVDQLTPGGQLPEGNAVSAGLGALKGLLG